MSTHFERQLWPRCKRVEVRGDSLSCILDMDHQFDLIDSYLRDPHVQFLNCKSLDDLVVFTRAWGPLYLVESPSERKRGTAVRRIDECQAHLRWLRAVHRMVQACRGGSDWRESLAEFLGADSVYERTSNFLKPGEVPANHWMLQHRFRFKGDATAWAASADISSIQTAVILCVEANVNAPQGGVKVEKKGRVFELIPSFELRSLWDALQWMLWLDLENRRPPRACIECGRIFRPLTARLTVYCSHACGHRVANRAWRRKDLRSKKRRRRA